MTGTMRAPRSRGMLSGVLLILLGLWGGLIPFVGPYADFAFTPDKPWHFTDDRMLFHVAPAAATVLGGLIVLASANRAFGVFGAWLAAVGGAWFVVGLPLGALWDATGVGTPLGDENRQVTEQLTFFSGLGVLIVFFAALALGRFAVVGVKESREADKERLAEEAAEYDARREREERDQPPWEHEREPEHEPAHGPAVTGPQSAGTTQPLPRQQGRFARPQQPPEPPPPMPDDQRVAGNQETPGQTRR